MSSHIFYLVNDGGKLASVDAQAYDQETELQLYLERHPNLIPGDQIDPNSPRKWLLVKREMPVYGSQPGSRNWSLDHLFLDQDGRPTLVECKLSGNPEIRRKVVAQMIEYASNGASFWTVDDLRKKAVETAQGDDQLNDSIVKLLSDHEDDQEPSVESFWESVKAHLTKKSFRLIFVADTIPFELRTMIEFLNEKMNDIDLFGVEVRKYTFPNDKGDIFVPRVVGMSDRMRVRKSNRTTEYEFLSECTEDERVVYEHIFATASKNNHILYWGQTGFSLRYPSIKKGRVISYVSGYPLSRHAGGTWVILDQGLELIANLGEKLSSAGFNSPAKSKNYKIKISQTNNQDLIKLYDELIQIVNSDFADNTE